MPRAYARLVCMFPAFLIVYLCIVMSQHVVHDRGEIFPFFNWSLFSKPKKVAAMAGVRVLALDETSSLDRTMVGQVIFDRAIVANLGTSFQKAVSRYSRALKGRQSVSVEESERLVSSFLRPYGITEYEVVRIYFDPLERYRTDRILKIRTISRVKVPAQP